jgi:hypothetical protein
MQKRRDPRKAVAAFTAAVLASAWLAVAAWGGRESATPVSAPSASTSAPQTESSPQSSALDNSAGSADAPSMSTGQS